MLGIVDEYAAYCLDEAVAEFGALVSGALNEVEGKTAQVVKAKQELVLKSMLGDPREQYAAPVPTTTNSAALKEFED